MSAQQTGTGAALEISAEQIRQHIADFAAMSETEHGVTRLGYSLLERTAHDAFRDHMEALGLQVAVDTAGNTIAELAPNTPRKTPHAGAAEAADDCKTSLGTGSHLDSVPSGGRFDGIAGVVAAMELARVAVQQNIPRSRPWRFVVFATEEGARFGQACNGSRAIAGLSRTEDLHRLHDVNQVTMYQAMKDSGLDPDNLERSQWNPDDWKAFIELHVEQGNILEEQGIDVGVVELISGSSRISVTINGVASHTGATPMHLRKDALAAAAECILAGERIANDPQHHGTRITVGRLSVRPSSITTIPGEVEFTVDIRDLDSQRQRDTANALMAELTVITERRGVTAHYERIGDTSPAMLAHWLVEAIAGATKSLSIPYRIMASGASHDAQQISRIIPTGMIFVPSRGGLSHVPEEWTDYEQIATGTRALLAAFQALDAEE